MSNEEETMTREQATKAVSKRIPTFAYKVHPAYVGMDWDWASTDGIPTPKDIMDCAHRLLELVEEDEGESTWCTGGIEVAVYEDDDGWAASLRFVHEEGSYDE